MDRRELLTAGGAVVLLAAGSPLLAAEGAGSIASPIALDEGRILLAAFFGRKGPYILALDTGSPINLISQSAAEALGLRRADGGAVRGIGGRSEYGWYSAGEVSVGSGLVMRDVRFAGIADGLSSSAVGAFGAGLLTTYDSDLDFRRSEWRLWLDGRPDREGFERLPSRFTGGPGAASKILLDAGVGAYSGEFVLDTGAPGEISLASRATARSGLWNDQLPYAPAASRGIGRASVPGRFVRTDRLKIGPFVWERPLVKLTAPGSPLGVAEADGLIGLRAIRRLNLSVDTRRGVLWAAANGLSFPANDYGMSGLWIEESRGGLEIVDVGTGSPAAKAGLRKGDVIVGEAREPFLRRITQAAGTKISFDYVRAGGKARVELVLADYL